MHDMAISLPPRMLGKIFVTWPPLDDAELNDLDFDSAGFSIVFSLSIANLAQFALVFIIYDYQPAYKFDELTIQSS